MYTTLVLLEELQRVSFSLNVYNSLSGTGKYLYLIYLYKEATLFVDHKV